ncbi:hypothetical protein KPL71_026945 [Citrus sinensis]|uniref:Uncharacterized protein n=1 Tax=Citrus sinensis TaxID=2711 RepID=A0ACB8I4H3_CITSI|nr:hypothetical protein KPL71_026945 [Citrus sinensis]
MATSYRFMVLIFVVLLSTLHQFSSLSAADSSSSYRSLLAVQRNNNRIPRCNEMGSRSECLQNPKCKRCRSEALDDMCFSKSEAWRLPHQIGLLGLVWNVAGYMAGIAMVLEDGGYVAGITVGWRVTGYVAIRVLPLEEGIATGSLAVGVFPLIFESFVG